MSRCEKDSNYTEILKSLATLFDPETDVFELCVIHPRRSTSRLWKGPAYGRKPIVAGWFDSPETAARLAAEIDNYAMPDGIYVTLNPVQTDVHARAYNRLKTGIQRTKDDETAAYRHVLIDIDPVRPSGVSSTDEEHRRALDLAWEIHRSWPGLLADSGNGAHLVLRFEKDVQVTEETKSSIKRFLEALHARFQTDQIKIDASVYNPSRLVRLWGTWTRKGDHTKTRPHRPSKILHLPDPWPYVSLDQLDHWSKEYLPVENEDPASSGGRRKAGTSRLNVDAYLAAYGVEVVGRKRKGDATFYQLRNCVFDPAHGPKEAAVVQADDGRLAYHCFHDSCKHRTWHEAKAKISGEDPLVAFLHREAPVSIEPGPKPRPYEPLPPLPPWPMEAFPAPYQRLISEVTESLSVPLEMAATAFLSATAACIGRTRQIYDGREWYQPPILWFALVAPSGSGKSPTCNFIFEPIKRLENEWFIEFRSATAKYKEKLDIWKSAPKEGRGPKPEPPRWRQLLIDDATGESIAEILFQNPRGLLWNSDELAGMMANFDRYSRNKGGTKSRLMTAYDAGQWKVSRVDSNRQSLIPHAAISIFGTIQPEILPTAFSMMDVYSGFFPRFQFIFAERDKPPFYTEARVSAVSKQLLHDTVDHLLRLDFDPDGSPYTVEMDDEARSLFREWQNGIALLPWIDPRGEKLEPFAQKMRGRALRLALVLHELDCYLLAKPDTREKVSRDVMERSIRLADVFLAHQHRASTYLSLKPGRPPSPLHRRIAQAIVELSGEIERGSIPTARIAEHLNAGRDPKFHVSAQSVGKAASDLGLHPRQVRYRGRKCRCIGVDDQALQRLHAVAGPKFSGTPDPNGTKREIPAASARPVSDSKRDTWDAQTGPEDPGVPVVPVAPSNGTAADAHESLDRPGWNVCPGSLKQAMDNEIVEVVF
ncbi:Protein of unknown function [Desulfacinum infernum DSM 9756]|uniref:DUF3987 domain-containing protein n=1 Tax=Desulfacinum infernum DSM 9756 TaxID=1121391 RepID=A0A1M5FA60_9BACT|nr:DUF3987 domain-containing protein [Desulfacinum infernum]SHF88453.1 Protein of unknown function [Desulfacinum infernum DSM 9756]